MNQAGRLARQAVVVLFWRWLALSRFTCGKRTYGADSGLARWRGSELAEITSQLKGFQRSS